MDLIDEFSPVCLAILVGLPCQAVDVLDTIEELLKQQRELSICEWTMALSSLPMP